jgi:hypothetical protein
MIKLDFGEYEIKVIDESSYEVNSADKTFDYDFVYQDEESEFYQSTNHGIKVYKNEEIIKSGLFARLRAQQVFTKIQP